MTARLTPLLALMAGESADRQQRYAKRMRDAGNVKVTVWCSAPVAPVIKLLAGLSTSEHAELREVIEERVMLFNAELAAQFRKPDA